MTVHFIGAGPGAPDLITVRGLRLIRSCAVVLYAGRPEVDPDLVYGHMARELLPQIANGMVGVFLAALLASVSGLVASARALSARPMETLRG